MLGSIAESSVHEMRQQLKLLLDKDYVLAKFQDQWSYLEASGRKLVDCKIQRLHPRGGRGYVIEYKMHFESDQEQEIQTVFGQIPKHNVSKTFDQALDGLRKTRRKQISWRKPVDKISLLPDLGLILRFSGLDEKIDGLKVYYKPKTLLPHLPEDWAASLKPERRSELLAHRLGKRGVVRIIFKVENVANERSAVLKFYKNHSPHWRRSADILQFLNVNGFGSGFDIAVPRLICTLPGLHGFVMEDISGIPLSEVSDKHVLVGMAIAGRALAKLHASPLKPDRHFGTIDEIALLEQWSKLISDILPENAGVFDATLERVRDLIENCSSFEPGPVHRDYHEKQILIGQHKAFLVDFDTLCMGDQAQDIGNFLAHIRFKELQHNLNYSDQVDAFCQGYKSLRALPDDDRCLAHYRSTLFRLACIYAFSSRWKHLSVPLLEAI